ncbi:MAG TPA: alpha/beta hydrolase [Cytophagales bacterium]|nr:alpha/beta hydrolase [Cytophagales bacterium]HAP58168.1 alpha/beta hydrolase [Cytophagales bacterium]
MTNLLLLHGALGSAALFDPLASKLESDYTVHRINFAGHGGEPFPEGGYSMPHFGQNVLAYLDAQQINQINIFGYSMGGYVALWLAHNHPDRIGKIFTLATKFAWSPESAAQEGKMLNADKIAEKVPKFAAALEARHAPLDWRQVLSHTKDMMEGLGANPLLTEETLKTIPHDCLIAVGDQDQMVSREETMHAAQVLPKGKFACMANTPHPLEKVDTARLAQWIREFIG